MVHEPVGTVQESWRVPKYFWAKVMVLMMVGCQLTKATWEVQGQEDYLPGGKGDHEGGMVDSYG